jgi:hypothetical protein
MKEGASKADAISRWKSGPSKRQRPFGSECCVTTGDSGREAYTAVAWGLDQISRGRCYASASRPSLKGSAPAAGQELEFVHELFLIIQSSWMLAARITSAHLAASLRI